MSAAASVAVGLVGMFLLAAPAQASFGVNNYDVTFTNADGTAATQAGSHPFAMTTSFGLNYDAGTELPEGRLRDFFAKQVPGFLGDNTAYPRCTTVDFFRIVESLISCPLDTQVGAAAVAFRPDGWRTSPLYNLTPPPGVIARLGFAILNTHIVIDVGLNPNPPYNILATARNTSQVLEIFGSTIQLWGNPSDSAHDELRGECGVTESLVPPGEDFELKGEAGAPCPGVAANPKPFLTLPATCASPLSSSYEATSWEGASDAGSVLTHDTEGRPQPFAGCGHLGFKPSIAAQPTTKAATSPTGLDFSLDVKDEGLTSIKGLAQSQIEKAVVTLPEGMSANPSQAEGLAVCTETDLANETPDAEPGQGCPQASKIGTVEVESPLVEEPIKGGLYVAKPYENLAGNSLIAVYLVFKSQKLGIDVKQPLRVESNPFTGQLTTVAEDIPQLPFSHFRLHFREGTRSPLVSPPTCGNHAVKALLYPWSGGEPVESTSTFQIISGPDNGSCPSGGLPPFHPFLSAGTLNNAAGKYSPFNTRITRSDSEQEITNFSIKLPPGVIGKLAGIPYCSDAAIAAAKARTGPHGGLEEEGAPSCPKASEIGHSLVGAGVGPSLAYAPGRLYLAGPYQGSQLSLVSVTAAKVGPFDLGTVVVRFALKINPETAEVFVDATGSDPIPHIIQGIPVHLRDIRAYVDRPEFVLNPTSCKRTSTASTLLGSGLNFASASDDVPVTVTSPFQAADCASLGFAPKLALSLKGGTKRGDTPAFKAVLTYPKGYQANIAAAQVTLPHSVFLEQAHIKTICTRAQFAAGAGNGAQCPAASVYGFAKAVTPLLDSPIQGPVYLRSSSHKLPDLVAALHNGQISIDLDGHIDSVGNGRIRNTFEAVPDAPVSTFTLEMQGGKKGLLVNSTNLCKGTNRALADFTGQNGKVHVFKPALVPDCGKKAKKGGGKK